MENNNDISSPSACQTFCLIFPGCEYFIYNAEEENCQFLSSSSRTCDLIRAPPTPALDECLEPPSKYLLTLFFETLEKQPYQNKPCYLENHVEREPCKRLSVLITVAE